MDATAQIDACLFRKSVAHNELARFFALYKFAVIRQFR
jgi:hypothetical protein